MNRECNGCTKCCEGWLSANIYGHEMHKGAPCHFLDCGKCSIYKDRPQEPCVSYQCAWKEEKDSFPAWLKPDVANIIINRRNKSGFNFYEFTEAGSKIDSLILNWILQWSIRNKINIVYQVDGQFYRFGSRDFLSAQL